MSRKRLNSLGQQTVLVTALFSSCARLRDCRILQTFLINFGLIHIVFS